jgi:hypothetical protein
MGTLAAREDLVVRLQGAHGRTDRLGVHRPEVREVSRAECMVALVHRQNR